MIPIASARSRKTRRSARFRSLKNCLWSRSYLSCQHGGCSFPIAARPSLAVRICLSLSFCCIRQLLHYVFRKSVMPISQLEALFELPAEETGFIAAHRVKAKPYALIEFSSSIFATRARERLHGTFSEAIGKWIFLFFASRLPPPLSDLGISDDSTTRSTRASSCSAEDESPMPCASGELPPGLRILLLLLFLRLIPCLRYRVHFNRSFCVYFSHYSGVYLPRNGNRAAVPRRPSRHRLLDSSQSA